MSRAPITRSCCDNHTRRAPGCRPCLDRAARWQKQYEYELSQGLTRTVPSAPYVEMVGRLNANGWPGHVLAEKIGWGGPHFTRWQLSRRTNLSVSLADRIARVTLELRDYPGPSSITRARALAAGFTPYLDRPVGGPVIDVVAIDRALAGERVPMSPEERAEAVRIGVERGLLPYQIGRALHMSGDRVRDYLAGEQPKKRGAKKKAA